MRVTMAEIAQRANVSLITVSRALNNRPDVSEETRSRIWALAEELHYVPNVLARALVSGSSHTLGLIVADNTNPYYGRLIRAVEDTARSNGYGVILCNTDEDPEYEVSAHKMLREKRVDGILITSIQSGSSPLRSLAREGTPFVLLNRYVDDLEVDCVVNDNASGAYEATAHLCRLGHRRILHLTGPHTISSVRERLAGYRQALAECGAPFNPSWVLRCNLRLEGGYEAALAALAAPTRPTAIFAYSDLLAIGVLKAARELGLQIPQDVALVGYDDIEFAPFVDPPLTTAAQQSYEIGRRGAEILLEKLRWPTGEAWKTQRVIYKPQLVIRASCGGPVA